LEGSKVPEKGSGVQSESTASTVLSPEDVSEIKELMKKVSVLDEKFNNFPEMIKQDAREYVQGIGGPAPS